jgi:ubiquinone/menaquinone biosynthesis C-methylase UbiE
MRDLMSRLERLLSQEPVFCFGCDTDWNSDVTIELILSAFTKRKSKVTAFATHSTPLLTASQEFVEVAVHPNFLPGSTHGASIEEVIDHVFKLYPRAKSYRAHSYYDNQRMTELMAARGIRYDANLCLYRQSHLTPLRHCHIDWRYPSWLDDNIHWGRCGSWRLEDLKGEIEKPGLKIINIHPPSFALNLPNRALLNVNSSVLKTADAAFFVQQRFDGYGAATFLIELLEWLAPRHPTYHLSELNTLHTEDALPSVDPRLLQKEPAREIEGRPPIAEDYPSADDDARMQMVRAQYDRMRERGRYATSRDYNNREIEIHALRQNMKGNRVLDLGCGTGYTLLALASSITQGRLVGVDFSQTMVDAAIELAGDEFAHLRMKPEYVCADAFAFLDQVSPGDFDTIISERLIVNLPSWDRQRTLIEMIIDRLPAGGRYLMVEGSAEGFKDLNEVRVRCGLSAIPDRYAGNESSNKLDERQLNELLKVRDDVLVRHENAFSFYTIASKVLHPLLVAPEEPKFASPINDHARFVQLALTEAGYVMPVIGAAKLWVIEKRDQVAR